MGDPQPGWELPDRRAATRDPRIVAEWQQYPLLRDAWNLITTHRWVTPDPIGPWDLTEGRISGEPPQIDNVDSLLHDLVTQTDHALASYNADPAAWASCYPAVPQALAVAGATQCAPSRG